MMNDWPRNEIGLSKRKKKEEEKLDLKNAN